jgi:GxxExxY protein
VVLLGPHQRESGIVLAAAVQVHSVVGPGMLESAYEACLAHEIRKRGLAVETQVAVSLAYDSVLLDTAYRIDLLVERCIIIEVKSIRTIEPVHLAQVQSYLRATGLHVGILINFNVLRLVNGYRRILNDRPRSALD